MSLVRLGIFFQVVLVFASACAPAKAPVEQSQPFAPGVFLTLPVGPPFELDGEVQNLVQADYGHRQETFQSLISSAGGRFTVDMSVPSGPHLMQIVWGPDGVTAKKSSVAPSGLLPERILKDLMMVYAPDEALRRSISGGELVIEGQTRIVRKDGRDLIVVRRSTSDRWAGNATLTNFAYNYSLDIQSRRTAP